MHPTQLLPPTGASLHHGDATPDGHDVAELAIPSGTVAVLTPGVTLRAAAAYLDRHGWCQGAYYDQTVPAFTPGADMVGAIGIICYGGPVDAPAQHFDAPEWAEFEAAVACLDQHVSDRFDLDVYTFNDVPGRTHTEIRHALHVAALLSDNRHSTPVCCQRLMAEQPASPAVFPPDGHGSWTLARVFRCGSCQRLAMRQIGDCGDELRAADRAKAIRREAASARPGNADAPTTVGGGA